MKLLKSSVLATTFLVALLFYGSAFAAEECALVAYEDHWIGSDGKSHHAAFYRCNRPNNKMVVKTTFGPDKIRKIGETGWVGYHRPELGNNIYMVLVDGGYFAYTYYFLGYNSLSVYRTVRLYHYYQ